LEQKQFSVVIPTYNCGVKLAATLDSVLSQPRELYEIIVVDGGSGGETLDVIEEHSGRLRFVSEPDRGVYDAINKGVGMSSGRHLLFLGAGDRLKDGVLERVAEVLPEGGVPTFAYGDAYLVRHDLRQGGTFGERDFVGRNLCQQAIFYERKIFELLGGFDLRYKVYADWAFNMKCFGDARVRKLYLGLLVADFEGWGISDVQEDPAFWKDLPGLVMRHVGFDEYLKYRVYLARVSFYLFRHKLADSLKAALPALPPRRQKP
jgi:glycosyltransferase involved in cell wall biosynthesis